MRILVLGAGAIGGYYGAELISGGADVTFLVREQRLRQLQTDGLVIEVDGSEAHLAVRSATVVPASETFDLVLMSCKTYDLESAMDAVAPAVAGGALVLPLLNGLEAYERLDDRFGRDKVLGGVAYVAVSLEHDARIRRSAGQDQLLLGARSPAGTPVAGRLLEFLSRRGTSRALSGTIEQELWNKWVMIAAGAAMTCLMRGRVKDILAASEGELLMRRAIHECAAVASASGFPIANVSMRRIEAVLLDAHSLWMASMARDIAAGAPRLESTAVLGDMVRRAQSFSLEAPIVSCAYCHAEVYELKSRESDPRRL